MQKTYPDELGAEFFVYAAITEPGGSVIEAANKSAAVQEIKTVRPSIYREAADNAPREPLKFQIAATLLTIATALLCALLVAWDVGGFHG